MIERDYFELAKEIGYDSDYADEYSGVLRLNTRFQTFADQGIEEVFVYSAGETLLVNGTKDWYKSGGYSAALMDPKLYENVINYVSGKNYRHIENGARRLMPIAHVPSKIGDFPLVVQMMELNPELIGFGLHGVYFMVRNLQTYFRIDEDKGFIKEVIETDLEKYFGVAQ